MTWWENEGMEPWQAEAFEEELAAECSRGPEGCSGELFVRTSRSGLTTSTICEGHAAELEAELDEVAERYPEVNHPEGCTCWGCSEGSY